MLCYYCEAEAKPPFKYIAMHLPTHLKCSVLLVVKMPPTMASMASTLSSLPGVHDALSY